MPVAKTTYRIYDQKTGQAVALIDADGTLHEEGDPEAIAKLRALLQRELIVRERELGAMPTTMLKGMSYSQRGVCATSG